MMEEKVLNLAKRIKSISEVGLLYCKNEYDIERYEELQTISLELMHLLTGKPVNVIENFYDTYDDYPTPKVDVRALILNEAQQILLVKESMDGRWSLPGGWADIGLSPTEVVLKECKEETGLTVACKHLLAVFDKKCHNHPPQPHYVYKLIFYCEALTSEINKGFDVLEVAFFDIDKLPELSEDRILKSQIALVYQKLMTNSFEAMVD